MARAIRPGLKNNINAICKDYHLNVPHRQYHGALLDAHMLAKVYLAMTRNELEFSTMSLLEQIELRWAEVQKNGYAGDKWAKALAGSQENLLKAVKTFHQWAPLKVYLSVARAAKPRIAFSLRYQGQHVANLLVDLLADRSPQLEIDKNTAKTNKGYFEIDQEGTFGWRDAEAKEFRKHFKKNLGPEPRGRSPEHRIESIFLQQMADSSSKIFNGTLKNNIQPVLFAGCPFQLPVPISGNTGKPEAKRGNVDIVARRRVGNRTRLSIWELKRPGVTAHAIEQAYIYGVTVLKMLRAKESGHIWYKEVLGFNGKMPDKLTIECVVAVSLNDIKKAEAFLGKLRRFVTENSLQVEGDTIEFYLANYTENQGPLSIDFTKV
jgi:transposase